MQKRAAEERELGGRPHTSHETSAFLRGDRIEPKRIDGTETAADLIEGTFLAYNAARLREASQLLTRKDAGATHVGRRSRGAHPAGRQAAIIPLIEAGFVEWIVSTWANLYNGAPTSARLAMHRGTRWSPTCAQREGVVALHIFFDYDVLLSTDAFFRNVIRSPEFQRSMSSAEFHNLAGKYLREREHRLGIGQRSLLSAAYGAGVPVYTSSPGDSSIGMNIAALALDGSKCVIDPNQDVNETAAIVLAAKHGGGRSAVLICGGGSPKNFALQTEPQIQEVPRDRRERPRHFLQITDARRTPGPPGATPAEDVSWGRSTPSAFRTRSSAISTRRCASALDGVRARTAKPRQLRDYTIVAKMMDLLRRLYEESGRRPNCAESRTRCLPMHR